MGGPAGPTSTLESLTLIFTVSLAYKYGVAKYNFLLEFSYQRGRKWKKLQNPVPRISDVPKSLQAVSRGKALTEKSRIRMYFLTHPPNLKELSSRV